MKNASLILTLLALLLLTPLALSPSFAQETEEAVGPEVEATEGQDGENSEQPSETADKVEETAPSAAEDLQSLRAEYFKLRDRLFQSRARSSAVSSALYSTRLAVQLNYDSARYYTVTRATIRLDGANIYDDSEGSIAEDKAPRFEGFIAPGRHQLSIRIEATGKDDQRFTSVMENTFVVQATKGKDLEVTASASDGGDMSYKWSKKEKGSYRLHLNVSVKSVKRGKMKDGHIKRTGALPKRGPSQTSKS